MSTHETNLFLFGWRGFLVGTRRAWHAHEQNLAGHRQGFLVGNISLQGLQLRRVFSLAGETLARGSLIWGFGFSLLNKTTRWGSVFAEWRPGTLSNHFLIRARRVHLLRRLRPLFRTRRLTRRRRRARLTRRWARLYRGGKLPPGGYPTRTLKKRLLLGGFSFRLVNLAAESTQWGGPWDWPAQPLQGHARVRTSRGWWRAAPGLARLGWGRLFFPRVGPRGVHRGALRVLFCQSLTRRAQRRKQRVDSSISLVWTAGVKSPIVPFSRSSRFPRQVNPSLGIRRGGRFRKWHPRRVKKFQTQPFQFPGLVLGGGLTPLGATLLEEVFPLGSPLIYFGGGTTSSVRAGFFSVGWNSSVRSLEGVTQMLETLQTRNVTRGVWRILWGRLSRG